MHPFQNQPPNLNYAHPNQAFRGTNSYLQQQQTQQQQQQQTQQQQQQQQQQQLLYQSQFQQDTSGIVNPIASLNLIPPLYKYRELTNLDEQVYHIVQGLLFPEQREETLAQLSKIRESYSDLAIVLWNSYGVMMALMQEMISVYPLLNPPVLEYHQATRVCNALAMLQCIASHPDIRLPFLKSQFPLFLYPFLATQNPNKSFDHLRLTSLGVIGALVKSDNSEVIQILLTTEIVPLCLKVMINGSELAKTVAIFIIQKIVTDNYGLEYACEFNGRFKEILHTLAIMIQQLQEGASLRILKHVIKCYLRLSEHPAARKVLREVLPEALRDATFSHILKDDAMAKRWLAHLLANLSDNLVQGN